jgi:hypothetical protein
LLSNPESTSIDHNISDSSRISNKAKGAANSQQRRIVVVAVAGGSEIIDAIVPESGP